MAEGSNVGSIYLDLVVKDTVQKQVAAIGANAKADAQQAFSGLEKVIADTVGKAVEKLSQSVQSAANQVEAAVKAVSTSAERATEKATAEMSKASQAGISSMQSIQATVANIEQTIAATAAQASGGVSQAAQVAAQETSASMQTIVQKAQTVGVAVENAVGGSFNKAVALAQAKVSQLETALAAVTAKFNEAKINNNDAAAQRLGTQQEAIYDRLAAARERLSIQNQAAAQRDAATEGAASEAVAATVEATARRACTASSRVSAAWMGMVTLSGPIKSAFQRIADSAETMSVAFRHPLQAADRLLGAITQKAARFVKVLAKATIGRLVPNLKSAKQHLSSAGKSAHHFGVRLKGIISSALFFNLLSRGLTNIVKYMGTALGSSEELQDALANLKGAAATAAAPLIDALVPALTALANGAATAMSYLSRLVSNLTGKSVASMSAAAKKIKSTADAAKKATAGFDEIEKLGDSDSSSKEPNYDFQGQSSMMDSVLQAVQNGDWGQIGQIFAQKVNGIVESIDWTALGEKVANALIVIPEMVIGFVLGTDWAQLGQSISEGLISAMNGLTSWIQSVDWGAVGDQIATFVKNIDWGGIATSAFELLGSAIGAAGALIWGAIDEAVASIGDYFTGKIEECGGNVVGGLLKGIWDGLVNIGNWIKEHVFNPLINGIKEAFGIHSPSTVMAEMGDFLIQGFLGGITETWNKIAAFFGDAFTGLKNLIKGAINGILGFINGLISGVVGGVNLIVQAMNKLKFDVPDWVPGLGGKTFGFNLPEITAPQIPLLANGGVIKQPTLAMMGEYPSANSNPEIVAPQSVIADTVALVMEDMIASNIAGFEAVVAVLREILEAVLGIEIGDDVIGRAVARYNRKMAIVRGGL